MRPLIDSLVEQGSVIHHDNNSTYGNLRARGFVPKRVPKKAKGKFQKVNNNCIEGTWSRFKRMLRSYGAPRQQHLQNYANEFCLRARGSGKWLLANLELASLLVISHWNEEASLRMTCGQ